MSDLKYFPATRFTDYNKFNYYYAYGNTPPEDLLQSVTGDVSEPEVLLLGCGDIRSCLYTLWNNFDPRHSRHFKGVHFVLNDISAAVLARNIIFLYLCTKMPSDKNDVMKWVASFWSIWFCHELLPQHKQVLMDTLSQLLKWSESIQSWSQNSDNPLQKIVQFATSESLAKVCRIWKMWYSDDQPVSNIRTARSKFLKLSKADDHQSTETHLVRLFGNYFLSKLTESDRKHMKHEYNSYYKDGFVFAEELLNLPLPTSTSANPTFFEANGTYNLHGNSFPYRCFFHSFQFSSENLKKLGYIGFSLKIKSDKFTQQPLFANSVQQFSVWIRSCAELISDFKSNNILFTFQCSDAVEFCQFLSNYRHHGHIFSSHFPCLFDAIYASNLIDYIALPSLVLTAISVLKRSGILFTDTFRHIMVSHHLSGFTKALFGFESKHLPLICKVRSIGDDDEFSDQLSIKPLPYTAKLDVLFSVVKKSLIWQHVVSTPLKQITEEHCAFIMEVLCRSVRHMLTCCIGDHNGSVMESLLCTATVMQLLKCFAFRLHSEEYDCTKYEFWGPLCYMLLNQNDLKVFLMSLQTQALLHGLHLHLTLSESDCPLCNKTSVHKFVCQCSIMLEYHVADIEICNEPRLSILIHNLSPVDTVVMQTWKKVTSVHRHVHVLDSIAGREKNGKLQLDFFLPVRLLQDNYYASVILCKYDKVCTPVSVALMHKKLNDCQVTENCYLFSQCIQSCPNPVCLTFGKVTQHSGNADHFESIIAFSDQSMSALEHRYQVTTSQLSTTRIDFRITDLHTEISYPYPIDYTRMSIKLSRKSKRLTVVAHRKYHQLYEEKPVYIVNPDNILSLPTMLACKEDDMEHYSFIQFSTKEHAVMLKTGRNPKCMPPEINLKETWTVILQKHNENFFQLVYDGTPTNVDQWCQIVQCFLVIQNRKFDLHNKTPAIDLYFCFLTPEKCKTMYTQWISAYENETTMSELRDIVVDKEECWLLQNLLTYFASRTVSTVRKPINARYKLLVNHNISQYFTRAVVYPLYPNSNATDLEMPSQFSPYNSSVSELSPDQKKCSFCGNNSENLKKCSRCRLALYCNQDCQKKHWGTHKSVCHPQKPK